MRRDMDLVRSILLQVEAATGPVESGELDYGGHSQQEVYYHIDLMANRGLIDADLRRDWSGRVISATVSALTWDGQDYLDAMRDDRVWSRAKAAIAKGVGSTTFGVIKAVCVEVATKLALAQV